MDPGTSDRASDPAHVCHRPDNESGEMSAWMANDSLREVGKKPHGNWKPPAVILSSAQDSRDFSHKRNANISNLLQRGVFLPASKTKVSGGSLTHTGEGAGVPRLER